MRPASTRVVASHSIARRALVAAGAFAALAAGWAVIVLVNGGSWWGPLHAFLAGTVLLAISGVSQMFTITWAAASPPPAAQAHAQRWSVVAGVAAVLVGVTVPLRPLVWAGAASIVAGLVLLAVSIRGAVKRSLLRRFDLSARFYLAAFACGAVGMTLGALLGTDLAGESFDRWRLVHSHLNLVGLVGLTIVGTIPTFMPTIAHHRAVSGAEARVAWWTALAGVVAIAVGLVAPAWVVGAGTLGVAAAGATMVAGIVARLWDKGRSRAQFLQVGAGVAWLVAWGIVDGLGLMSGAPVVPFSRWTTTAVLVGVGQVLLGSLAYLVPVLLGPPLEPKFSRMTAVPVVPLALVNLGGVALVAGVTGVAVVLLGLWLGDFGRRLIGLLLTRRRLATR